MIRLRNRIIRRGKRALERIDESVVRHYIAYNLFIVIYTVIVIPLLLRFSEEATIRYLSLVPFMVLSMISVFEMEKAAEKNPYAFIKVERLKYWVSLSFWLLITSQFVCLGLMMFYAKLNFQEEQILTLLNVYVWLVMFFIGVSLFSALFFGASFVGHLTRKLPRIKARACFRVMSNALSRKSPQEQKKQFFFKEGMKNYNEYLRGKFGFKIREHQRYYNYLRLVMHSENDVEIDRIRIALSVLARQLKEDLKLMDVLWALKRAVGETVSDIEDIYSEVDFEVGFRKWFSSHQDTIKFIIMFASLIISWIALMVRFMQ